jgi:hypothetical protein
VTLRLSLVEKYKVSNMLVGLQFRVQYRSNVCLACDLYAARAPVNVLILFFLRVSLNLSCADDFAAAGTVSTTGKLTKCCCFTATTASRRKRDYYIGMPLLLPSFTNVEVFANDDDVMSLLFSAVQGVR